LLTRIARLAPPEPSEEESMDGLEASETPEVEPSFSGAAAAFALEDLAAVEVEGAEPDSAASTEPPEVAARAVGTPAQLKELAGTAQSKSVRIPLERLDLMMNVVGALVINRTRLLAASANWNVWLKC